MLSPNLERPGNALAFRLLPNKNPRSLQGFRRVADAIANAEQSTDSSKPRLIQKPSTGLVIFGRRFSMAP